MFDWCWFWLWRVLIYPKDSIISQVGRLRAVRPMLLKDRSFRFKSCKALCRFLISCMNANPLHLMDLHAYVKSTACAIRLLWDHLLLSSMDEWGKDRRSAWHVFVYLFSVGDWYSLNREINPQNYLGFYMSKKCSNSITRSISIFKIHNKS